MERTPIALPRPYTYLVSANDQWGAIYHFMNETPPGTPAKTVRIKYTLDYQPGANTTNSRPLDVYFQDITGCGDSTYDVPGNGGAGQRAHKSRSWTAPRRRHRVLHRRTPARRWHRHRAQNDTQGYTLCTGVATYHENPPPPRASTPAACTTTITRRRYVHGHRSL